MFYEVLDFCVDFLDMYPISVTSLVCSSLYHAHAVTLLLMHILYLPYFNANLLLDISVMRCMIWARQFIILLVEIPNNIV